GQVGLDGLLPGGLADVARLVGRLHSDEEEEGRILRHPPDESAGVLQVGRTADRRPRTFRLGGVGDGDRLPTEAALVAGRPGDEQVAGVGPAADDGLLDVDGRLGGVHLDPDLRGVARRGGPLAEADAALGYQGEAVAALALDLDDERRGLAGVL